MRYTREQIDAGFATFFANLKQHVEETAAILKAAEPKPAPVVAVVVQKAPVWAWKEEEYY